MPPLSLVPSKLKLMSSFVSAMKPGAQLGENSWVLECVVCALILMMILMFSVKKIQTHVGFERLLVMGTGFVSSRSLTTPRLVPAEWVRVLTCPAFSVVRTWMMTLIIILNVIFSGPSLLLQLALNVVLLFPLPLPLPKGWHSSPFYYVLQTSGWCLLGVPCS